MLMLRFEEGLQDMFPCFFFTRHSFSLTLAQIQRTSEGVLLLQHVPHNSPNVDFGGGIVNIRADIDLNQGQLEKFASLLAFDCRSA